jgi:hypothetical protein
MGAYRCCCGGSHKPIRTWLACKNSSKAADEYLVILSNIGASFRDDLANAPQGEMEVSAEGAAGKLYFDVTDAAAVFAALGDCAKTLR